MDNYLTRLNELRKDYPIAGYIMIVALAAMIVLTIVQLSVGSYVPLIIGVILLFFYLFLAIVFQNARNSKLNGFHFWLSAAMLSSVSLIFVTWLVMLTLVVFNFICVPWMVTGCSSSSQVQISGYLRPSYNIIQKDSKSVPFEHKRSSCEGRSSNILRVCLADGFQVVSANTEGFESRNDNGTLGSPTIDPKNQSCAIVDWSAASGGRTLVQECRYHGFIKFVMNVHGQKTNKEHGQRFNFLESTSTRNKYVINYPNSHPNNAQTVDWEYSFQISKELDTFSKILAWLSDSPSWSILHASSEKKEDTCLSSEVQKNSLVVVVNC